MHSLAYGQAMAAAARDYQKVRRVPAQKLKSHILPSAPTATENQWHKLLDGLCRCVSDVQCTSFTSLSAFPVVACVPKAL